MRKINLNKVIDVVNKTIPSLKGMFTTYMHQETNPITINVSSPIGHLSGSYKSILTFVFNGIETNDKDMILFVKVLRYCGLPELQRLHYPDDTLKYHLEYDVTSYEVVYEYEKLMEQTIRGGGS